jgi:hypothetical protein
MERECESSDRGTRSGSADPLALAASFSFLQNKKRIVSISSSTFRNIKVKKIIPLLSSMMIY